MFNILNAKRIVILLLIIFIALSIAVLLVKSDSKIPSRGFFVKDKSVTMLKV